MALSPSECLAVEVADVPEEQLAFLNEAHGSEKIAHGGRGQNDLRNHLTGVRHDLKHKLQCPIEDLHAAALFHSAYGTEGFQGKVVPLTRRRDLQTVIGQRAEFLVYVNCIMDRSSFDAAVAELRRRCCLRNQGHSIQTNALTVESRPETGMEASELSEVQLEELMKVHFADWQQNVESCNFYSYRRPKIAAIAAYLGGRYAEVYAERMACEDESKPQEVPEMVRARQLGVFDQVLSGEVAYEKCQGHELDKVGIPVGHPLTNPPILNTTAAHL